MVSMAVSSRTLFHFTHTAENLVGILTSDFLPRFCLEEFESFRTQDGDPVFDMAVPMVCFCDLPLTNIPEHLSFYGNYGIGLTKEWGIRRGLNPVLYVSPQSDCNTHLLRVCAYAMARPGATSFRDFIELLSFVKPVHGEMFRHDEMVERYFYDEREWRYVPRLIEQVDNDEALEADFRLDKDEFLDDVKRAQANSQLGNRAALTFTPDDIRYIVVSDEREIGSMIRAIRQIKNRYEPEVVDLLASRIVSAVQICQDF